jgi:translation initiation factor IF-3
MAHTSSSKVILDNFFAKLEDIAVIDRPARLEGRNMSMFLTEKR